MAETLLASRDCVQERAEMSKCGKWTTLPATFVVDFYALGWKESHRKHQPIRRDAIMPVDIPV